MILSKDYLNIYTTSKQASQITYIIKKYCDSKNCDICDATAGMGGNSIYFCQYFKNVICIDVSENTVCFLEKNLHNYKNKFIINDNCIDILKIITVDVLFFDPPWGGKEYKNIQNIDLYIDNINIIDIINTYYLYAKIISLKAPLNFNLNINTIWKYKVYKIYKNDKITLFYNLIIFYK